MQPGRLVAAFGILFALTLAAPRANATPKGGFSKTPARNSVKAPADKFARALIAGDRDAMLAVYVSYEQLRKHARQNFSERFSKSQYDKQIGEQVDKLLKEFREARKKGPVTLDSIEILDVLASPRNGAVMAFVSEKFRIQGKARGGFPSYYLLVDGHWYRSLFK